MHPQESATTTHLISFLHPFNFSREKGVIPFGWPRITPSWRNFGSRGEHRCCGIAWRASQETLRVGPEARCGGGQHAQDIHFPQQQWHNYSILFKVTLQRAIVAARSCARDASSGEESEQWWCPRKFALTLIAVLAMAAVKAYMCSRDGSHGSQVPLMLAKSQLGGKVPTFEPQENHG